MLDTKSGIKPIIKYVANVQIPESESKRFAVLGVLKARNFLPLLQQVTNKIESTPRASSPEWI